MSSSAPLAIRADRITKTYRIAKEGSAATLGEALTRRLTRPARRIAGLLRGNAAAAADLTDSFTALDQVSFEIREGEVVGLVGRNGAGKTTLLRMLSRITEPTSGEGMIRGRVGSLLEVGTGFHPELSGRENIYLNGAILGMRRREIAARFDDIVRFAGVERFLETPVKHYSSGMYLRLAFSVAAHLDAEILLVDEVLAVGDAEFQRKCLAKMHDVGSSGRTVIFVSHNMAAIENLCSRALWMERGRLVRDGAPAEVISAYLGSYASSSAGRDLAEFPDRRGSGEIRFTRIEYLRGDGEPTDVVRAGEPLRIRLSFQVNESVPEAHFGVQLYTGMGTRVASPNTWACGYAVPKLEPGEHSLDLQIDALHLMPDRYYLSLWAAPIGQNVYDQLELCTVLEVEASDYYGSGRGLDAKGGILFFPCRWSEGP